MKALVEVQNALLLKDQKTCKNKPNALLLRTDVTLITVNLWMVLKQ